MIAEWKQTENSAVGEGESRDIKKWCKGRAGDIITLTSRRYTLVSVFFNMFTLPS